MFLHLANLVRLIVHSTTGHGYLGGLFPLFDVDREGNIPAFYSVITLLIASILAAIVAMHERRSAQRFWKHWVGIALVFAWIAIDEGCHLHELSAPLGKTVANSGVFFFAWIIPAFAILSVLGVVYFKMIFSLPSWFRNLAILSAAVFLSGAIGMEMFGGLFYEGKGPVFQYQLICAAEEFLEKTGVAIWIYALLRYLFTSQVKIAFSFGT